MRVDKEDKKVCGFVVYIRAYATANNPTYETGMLEVMYGGVGQTFLGNEGFEPYKTEQSALRGRKAWEKLFARFNTIDDAWKHQVGGVMPVTEAMYQEIDDQFDRDCEIVSKLKHPVSERLTESIEKAARKRNFKLIK